MTPKEKDGPLLGKTPMSGILTPFIYWLSSKSAEVCQGCHFHTRVSMWLIERLGSENAQTILARIPRTGFVGALHDDV